MTRTQVFSVLVSGAAIFGLEACASSGEQRIGEVYATAQDARDEVVCRRQRPVGSHIPVQVCRTQGQIDEDRERVEHSVGMLRTMSGNLPSAPPPPRPTN